MNPNEIKTVNSLLNVMEDGREFESLISYQYNNLNIVGEIRRSINEIKAIRSHFFNPSSIQVNCIFFFGRHSLTR